MLYINLFHFLLIEQALQSFHQIDQFLRIFFDSSAHIHLVVNSNLLADHSESDAFDYYPTPIKKFEAFFQ